MKNNLRRLQALIHVFGCASFYSCQADQYNTLFVGKYNPEVVLKALKYKFEMKAASNGYLSFRRGSYMIMLTD